MAVASNVVSTPLADDLVFSLKIFGFDKPLNTDLAIIADRLSAGLEVNSPEISTLITFACGLKKYARVSVSASS